MWTEYYDLTEDRRKAHDEEFGGYNDLPPAWTEVTERDVVKKMVFDYSPNVVQFRQMRVREELPMLSATLFFFSDGSGYARAVDWRNERLRWFTFASCEHDKEVIESRTCYQRSRCRKCKREFVVDSSD